MTAAKLVLPHALRSPDDTAEYFKFGAEYVLNVTEDMGWESGGFDETYERAYEAMQEGRTEVPDDEATLVGAVLLADAEYWWPIGRWLPRGYALLMRGLSHALRRKLLRLAGIYTDTLETGFGEFYHAFPTVRERLGVPGFSNPDDERVLVDGKPPTSYVRGLSLDAFARRTVLGDSVLHVEWFTYVADETGVEYDEELCERAIDESPAYFAGRTDELSDDVRKLQKAMFSDDDWIRDFHDHYSLRSILFKRAARGIEETAEELGAATET